MDDERLARQRVRALLAEEPDMQVVGECVDGLQAVELIERERPDLVFLDVQMPRMDGFEVIEATSPQRMPVTVFTTAHDEHALRAFEVHALDYLLKPFKQERFRDSLDRARRRLARELGEADPGLRALADDVRAARAQDLRLMIKSPERILFLRAAEIDHVESAGNYAVLHAGKDNHIMRETMQSLEQRLSGAGFMRVSRSAIVNLRRVREVEPGPASQLVMVLRDGSRITATCGLRELQRRLAGI